MGGNTYTSIEQVEANVKLSQATLSLGNEALAVGASKKLTPVFTYANDTSLNKDAIFTWSSSNPEVATVDENGLVCAVAAGETTITVTACGGLYATECTVSVTFNWNVTGWTMFGQGADLWYYDGGSAMSGTGTIIYDGTKLTLTMTKGDSSHDKDITDADIISGAKSFELNANCLVSYQHITISAIKLGTENPEPPTSEDPDIPSTSEDPESSEEPPVVELPDTILIDAAGNKYAASEAEGTYTYAINDGNGASTLTLPKINFTENTKVTFNWSVSGWTFFGQGADLWYYDSGSAMSGTGTIIYDGTKLTLTLTKGEAAYDKDITDADIISGAKAFELNANCLAGYQNITISAIELGQLPPPVAPAFVMDAATYNADGKVADASTTENGASYSLFEGAGYLTIAKVDFKQYTMVTYDWTLSGWTQFGVGADLWYYDGGSQMVGTVTVTNNGNGTLTMAVTKGESSYSATISDADVINGTKALTMNFNGLASYQSFTVSNFAAGQIPAPVFVMDAATYNADGKVADASATENSANYSLFEGAGSLTIAKVDFTRCTTATYNWTLSGWTQFGVGADLWYYDGGSQMVGTVTVTNNGNGTLTMVVTKGESSYLATISDADVINGTKALTMNFNGLASYQSFTVSNFTVA